MKLSSFLCGEFQRGVVNRSSTSPPSRCRGQVPAATLRHLPMVLTVLTFRVPKVVQNTVEAVMSFALRVEDAWFVQACWLSASDELKLHGPLSLLACPREVEIEARTPERWRCSRKGEIRWTSPSAYEPFAKVAVRFFF